VYIIACILLQVHGCHCHEGKVCRARRGPADGPCESGYIILSCRLIRQAKEAQRIGGESSPSRERKQLKSYLIRFADGFLVEIQGVEEPVPHSPFCSIGLLTISQADRRTSWATTFGREIRGLRHRALQSLCTPTFYRISLCFTQSQHK
jgi:hypothetical protein